MGNRAACCSRCAAEGSSFEELEIVNSEAGLRDTSKTADLASDPDTQALIDAVANGLDPDVAKGVFKVRRGESVSTDSAPHDFGALEHLTEVVRRGDVVLVRGSWIAELSRTERGVLPRRQDLPENAVWDPHEFLEFLEELQRKGWTAAPVVVVSYCWMTPEHPDPTGEQLRTLGTVLEQWIWWHQDRRGELNSSYTVSHWDIAVFIDWCSLYQLPRCPAEEAAFIRSRDHIDLWYAHRLTWVWLLTQVPGDCRPYSQRGWPTFERAVSLMAKTGDMVLDLGLLGPERCKNWPSTRSICRARRDAPVAPQDFCDLLRHKVFSVGGDSAIVEAFYSRTFEDVMGSAEVLEFNNLGWGDEEARQLSGAIVLCPRLKELHLLMNHVGDAGAARLAEALPRCEHLERLCLSGNLVGDKGAAALAAAIPRCNNLEALFLDWNSIEDVGREQLQEACRATGKANVFLDL